MKVAPTRHLLQTGNVGGGVVTCVHRRRISRVNRASEGQPGAENQRAKAHIVKTIARFNLVAPFRVNLKYSTHRTTMFAAAGLEQSLVHLTGERVTRQHAT
jgi:hypothetical protein